MNANKSYKKLLIFWVGPLVAGSCLAIGYEITHRSIILRSSWEAPDVELLKSQSTSNRQNLDSNMQKAMKSFSNSKPNELNKGTERYKANPPQFKDKEMQKLLNDLQDAQRQRKGNQNKNLNRSDNQAILEESIFDELFKTLPR